jgi:tetratricopeptide (TPR) repeat protein
MSVEENKENQEFYLEIDDLSYSKILELSKQGDNYAQRHEFTKAIDSYYDALDLVPDPLEAYSATTWLLTAIGESYLLSNDYENAREVLQQAMHCPDAIGNPFIHLILGQAQFELGNFDRAKDELARAYMGGGKEIFAGDDPKYYEYLKALMRGLD